MQAQEFRVVYDILQEGYLDLSLFPILWFSGIVIISTIFFFDLTKRKFKFEGINDILGVIILPLFLLFGVLAICSTFYDQWNCISHAKNNNISIVEGKINKLKTDLKSESFTVNEIKFEHREYELKCGYSQKKGIKLQNDKLVRISYHDGCILKFEIAE